jgi:hypothetical protein
MNAQIRQAQTLSASGRITTTTTAAAAAEARTKNFCINLLYYYRSDSISSIPSVLSNSFSTTISQHLKKATEINGT